jgi:histone arginine demethylase JMJD6
MRSTEVLQICGEWPNDVTPQSGPLCVRGVTQDWPIHELVSSGELKSRWGHELVSVVTQDGRSEQTTVGSYFTELAAGHAAGTYLKEWHVSTYIGELAEVPLPSAFANWFDQLPEQSRPDWTWIFVGPAGSGSPTHVDVMCSSAWNLLVAGTKEWTFHSPKTASAMGHLEPELVPVTGRDDDTTITFTQYPGDVVIVPGGWAHSVHNVDDTVSLTGNWVSRSNVDLVLASLLSTGQGSWKRLVEALRAHHEAPSGPRPAHADDRE